MFSFRELINTINQYIMIIIISQYIILINNINSC